jgi:C-terminal domain 6 of the ABC-three component (ABC-3C) systems
MDNDSEAINANGDDLSTRDAIPNFSEVSPPPTSATMLTPAQLQSGPPIEPLTRIMSYDPSEWEKFIDEWVSDCLTAKYIKILRYSGANDHGIDVAGFEDRNYLLGIWDNYQCKHYAASITPGTAWPEIGKMLWHSFNGFFVPPRAYYFVAPRGTGTTLTQYLTNAPMLKAALIEAWPKAVQDKITKTQAVKLDGKFADYVDAFDFSIFQPMSPREVIEQHRSSPYFISRFGGGLPPRPVVAAPPTEPGEHESIYIGQLLAAYADHTKADVPGLSALRAWKPLQEHFKRQRECFYHAESLRVFVRDKVEPGTFEGLQEEIYHGVVDTCDEEHPDGFERVKAVTNAAQNVPLDAHPLGTSAMVKGPARHLPPTCQ